MVKWIVVMKIQPSISLLTEESHEKPPVRLVGTGIRTLDLPNASLVRCHAATTLGKIYLFNREINKYITPKMAMLTQKNCSIRPMLFSKHEKPYRSSKTLWTTTLGKRTTESPSELVARI